MLTSTQVPDVYRCVIDEQVALFKKPRTVEERSAIPKTTDIPIQDPSRWLKIPDLVCVFVDMKNSTLLSATNHDKSTAGAYQLFTGTAVRLFDSFETPYIDVRGDGVFALFNADQVYRAFAAAVTFKTFAAEEFAPRIQDKTGLILGAHVGIDRRTVLVRKLGMKAYADRTDRQNEVWAGKPVNMASKLAGQGDTGELLVSDRYYDQITDELTRKTCGCKNGLPGHPKSDLWEEVDLSDDPKFDFDTGYLMKANWCATHGKDYCEAILALDA
jgi:class 3 adenylate cyclase